MKKTLRVQLMEADQPLLDVSFPTELNTGVLLARLKELIEDKTTGSTQEETAMLENVGKRYSALASFLLNTPGNRVSLKFSEVENILFRPLPPTARGQHARSWWANTDTHAQGKAWLNVGWRVDKIKPDKEEVEFQRR